VSDASRPAAVRVLRATGWVATSAGLGLAVPALAIGASNGFDELAKGWVVLAVGGCVLLLAGVTALFSGRRSFAGLVFGLIACALLLLSLLGTIITIAVAIIASQTWPQLRDYYGLRRRAA